jgi:catechol 2,3-dioxygenase-like lactoylglutathione lyase family enzyme
VTIGHKWLKILNLSWPIQPHKSSKEAFAAPRALGHAGGRIDDAGIAMIKVKRISHATFETPDVERLVDYYAGVVGLVPLAKEKDRVLFVSRLGDLSVILHRGAAPKLIKIAFQVAPHDDLPTLARALAGDGIRASVDHVSLPGIDSLLRFQDPKGTTIEIFNEAGAAAPVSQPSAVGPMKLGHISFMMPDIHPCIDFYQKVLGFRVSDWQEDFFCFMRCGTDHHTINFATGKSTRMHHMAFELKDWGHVQTACDHLGRNNVPIIWGPGRHGISHNIFIYHRDPDDQMIEFYTEMDQMLDEELGYFDPRPWHKDRPQRPRVWDRESAALIWGPPQGPDHARQRNME